MLRAVKWGVRGTFLSPKWNAAEFQQKLLLLGEAEPIYDRHVFDNSDLISANYIVEREVAATPDTVLAMID